MSQEEREMKKAVPLKGRNPLGGVQPALTIVIKWRRKSSNVGTMIFTESLARDVRHQN